MAKSNDNFFERVYAIVRQIPYGKVTSYGAIAKALGDGRLIWLLRELYPSSSLCTFPECTLGFAQD